MNVLIHKKNKYGHVISHAMNGNGNHLYLSMTTLQYFTFIVSLVQLHLSPNLHALFMQLNA
ncbi:hypothetical protein PVAG01_01976 [Phlyctema vagabunda]|uniref:Uncharacterized protein n=1 Tax=Phlyctema vagabunda TaxID=108571 RepID=A0ABR4PZ64_9HELO